MYSLLSGPIAQLQLDRSSSEAEQTREPTRKITAKAYVTSTACYHWRKRKSKKLELLERICPEISQIPGNKEV
jgi:hypothetical protein